MTSSDGLNEEGEEKSCAIRKCGEVSELGSEWTDILIRCVD